MKRKVKTKTLIETYPQSASKAVVTQQMLYLVRDELKSDILSVKEEFGSLKSGQDSLKLEMKASEQRLSSVFEAIKAEMHRFGLMVEEQRNNNRIVFDGLNGLFLRQERVETGLATIDKTMSDLKKPLQA